MISFLSLVLALTLHKDVVQKSHLYQHSDSMMPNSQLLVVLPAVKKDVAVKVTAEGNGKGDLDCYLLRFNDQFKGWVVSARDESKEDSCSISYKPTSQDEHLKLWITNHGEAATTYDVTVDQ